MAGPRIEEALAEVRRKRERENGLLAWVRDHFDELQRARDESGLTFQDMAEAAANMGVLNSKGRKPTAQLVRIDYWLISGERRRKDSAS